MTGLEVFFAKLVRLEEVGKDAGQPLGGPMADRRKIVVGDRNRRIIFTMNEDETVARVWVIGDRRIPSASTKQHSALPRSVPANRVLRVWLRSCSISRDPNVASTDNIWLVVFHGTVSAVPIHLRRNRISHPIASNPKVRKARWRPRSDSNRRSSP